MRKVLSTKSFWRCPSQPNPFFIDFGCCNFFVHEASFCFFYASLSVPTAVTNGVIPVVNRGGPEIRDGEERASMEGPSGRR
ncbi:hypothetical protein BT93_L3424 [Corymbia citriodora subsp. variegata]|uniref:Uncharacterized protein n=1 Tax=Corymbia citriodora subsp. variegata TaxID=360336 RepID=A0A8T0CIH7_CORYI|nr:hypothetical protein BT93_L3424 [Corymbia citriodora subsp. variegata]